MCMSICTDKPMNVDCIPNISVTDCVVQQPKNKSIYLELDESKVLFESHACPCLVDNM